MCNYTSIKLTFDSSFLNAGLRPNIDQVLAKSLEKQHLTQHEPILKDTEENSIAHQVQFLAGSTKTEDIERKELTEMGTMVAQAGAFLLFDAPRSFPALLQRYLRLGDKLEQLTTFSN